MPAKVGIHFHRKKMDPGVRRDGKCIFISDLISASPSHNDYFSRSS